MLEDDDNLAKQRSQDLQQATSWFLDMGRIDNDYMKNVIVLNIWKVSDRITEVEVLANTNRRQMLVYLDFTKLAKFMGWFRKISVNVKDMLQEALPTYEIGVIFDKAEFDRRARKAEEYAKGLTKPKEKEEAKEASKAGGDQNGTL